LPRTDRQTGYARENPPAALAAEGPAVAAAFVEAADRLLVRVKINLSQDPGRHEPLAVPIGKRQLTGAVRSLDDKGDAAALIGGKKAIQQNELFTAAARGRLPSADYANAASGRPIETTAAIKALVLRIRGRW
jgi:hypothetical protein